MTHSGQNIKWVRALVRGNPLCIRDDLLYFMRQIVSSFQDEENRPRKWNMDRKILSEKFERNKKAIEEMMY